jgi:ATP-dependent DNA helicase RecQ
MRHQSAPTIESGSYVERLREVVAMFGYESLSTEQDALIQASIEGFDILGVLPTGGGKSACFQIPGVVTNSKTLVISPLIALQDDQVLKLRRLGIKAFAFHSNQTDVQKMAARFYFKTAGRSEASFLYVSPEFLLSEDFMEYFGQTQFDRIAVDEAHCVSTWGDSFRPDYQRIRVAVQRLKIKHCSAFTATTDQKIEADIRKRLPLNPGYVTVRASPLRENIALSVIRGFDEENNTRALGTKKSNELFKLLSTPEYRGPVIIYCGARDTTVNLYQRLMRYQSVLRTRGYTRPYLFHANLPYEDKLETLSGFLNDSQPIVVATSAFGMGIDRADVRQVIHYQTPYTLIDFAQQFGRAGRDGLPSRACILHTRSDYLDDELKKLTFSVPDIDFVEQVHGWLKKHVAKLSIKERREYNLQKFMHFSRMVAMQSDRIRHKENYMSRVQTSVALLQRAGIIVENADGFSVFGLDHDSEAFAKLVKKTQMHERMQIREKNRVAEFFESAHPTQELLWEILARR